MSVVRQQLPTVIVQIQLLHLLCSDTTRLDTSVVLEQPALLEIVLFCGHSTRDNKVERERLSRRLFLCFCHPTDSECCVFRTKV